MVNFVETLWAVTALCALVGIVAFVQSRGGEERHARYGRRMRRSFLATLVLAIVAGALEWSLHFA
jgi:hypothetical protein